MPKQLARWNPARSAWETTQGQLCGHSDVYSETWPNSGMTRGGTAYELPTWEQRTGGSVSSSSPLLGTPRSQHGNPRNQVPYLRPLDQPQNLENQLGRLALESLDN